MSAGYQPAEKREIDQAVGNTIVQVREAFANVSRLDAWFDVTEDSVLTGYGYNSGEVETIRAALNALAKLAAVSLGQDTVIEADDFFFHGRKLTGFR